MKTLFSLIICIILSFNFSFAQSETITETNATIGLNSKLHYDMMEHNQDLRKLDILIDAKSNGSVADKSLTIGFSTIALLDYQKSNTDSKFAYLMRHPTSNNQIGESVSEAVIHSSQVSFIGSVNSWLTTYGELLYNPEQSFGAGTITGLNRNQIQFRKGIIMIGNLNSSPLYFSIGKMDIPFGLMGSVSPFTNSTMWHAFSGLGYGAILAYKKSGFNASFAAIQGGPQFRALNAPISGTNVPSQINNFSADANYTLNIQENTKLKIGASYLKGSTYCHSWPVVHFNPCEESNPAFTFYGELDLNDRLLIQGSFAKTQDEWPGTFNPNPPLDVFAASKVSSLDIGAKYLLNQTGDILYTLSAEFSDYKAGAKGSPWERQSQIVLGLNAQVEKTSRIFIELFRTDGYVPLNFLSGGNFEDLGETHSVKDANSHGIVAGILFSI